LGTGAHRDAVPAMLCIRGHVHAGRIAEAGALGAAAHTAAAGLLGVASLITCTAMLGIRIQLDAASRTICKSSGAVGDALTLLTHFVGRTCLVAGAAMGWVVRDINAAVVTTYQGRSAFALSAHAVLIAFTRRRATSAGCRAGVQINAASVTFRQAAHTHDALAHTLSSAQAKEHWPQCGALT